ncbi:MAG TPA: glucose 1-dehydrogenase [Methanocella sp.]|uniref:glucose 1-dehydrogenase n=1 Tax=Methanocella sp. TaxID=2052833 RepID=UPI002C3CE714|nr:glucose 1-dehydrogenase [Methanocella sp.]HTY89949.1 glucose 1-dehydrogenase [Methanocella sp.]
MRAAVCTPGRRDSVRVIDIDRPRCREGEALVRVHMAGVDGTDEDINAGLYGEAPEGCDFLVIGHEAVGIVEAVGAGVRCTRPGDAVVATVRRPCPGRCLNCRNHQPDFCITGDYLERGIKGLHGYMAEYYSESMDYLIGLPHELLDTGCLLEPLSVAEKGIFEAFRIQQRVLWEPRRALVLGAGPLGLLATFILRDMGLETYTLATRERGSIKARAAEASGARYIDVNAEPLDSLPKKYGQFDLIVDATGFSTFAFESMGLVNRNGIVCMAGLSPGKKEHSMPTDRINMEMVLNNKAAFGTVSASRRDFEKSVDRMLSIRKKWPGLMEKLFTKKESLVNAPRALRRDEEDIKAAVVVS